MSTPFKGFDSKSAYVRDRVRKGFTPNQIAEESPELDEAVLGGLVSRARASVRTSPNRNMAAAADARGISIARLRSELMTVIERDNMIDAILDDGIDSSKGLDQ